MRIPLLKQARCARIAANEVIYDTSGSVMQSRPEGVRQIPEFCAKGYFLAVHSGQVYSSSKVRGISDVVVIAVFGGGL